VKLKESVLGIHGNESSMWRELYVDNHYPFEKWHKNV
jgi:hypothetical protein